MTQVYSGYRAYCPAFAECVFRPLFLAAGLPKVSSQYAPGSLIATLLPGMALTQVGLVPMKDSTAKGPWTMAEEGPPHLRFWEWGKMHLGYQNCCACISTGVC